MSNDIAEALRVAARYYNIDGHDHEETVMWQGADEIEKLESALCTKQHKDAESWRVLEEEIARLKEEQKHWYTEDKSLIVRLEAEIERLKEYEWMYKDLCD